MAHPSPRPGPTAQPPDSLQPDAGLDRLRRALRFVDEFGGGPASDLDARNDRGADAIVAALRAIAGELREGLVDLERMLRR